jgi:hypothetical protein
MKIDLFLGGGCPLHGYDDDEDPQAVHFLCWIELWKEIKEIRRFEV